jgi:hypothetical protein
MVSVNDRAKLSAAIAEFKTGPQARQLATAKGFAVVDIDPRGRVVALKWRGMEVAVLYQREIGTVDVLPMENSPAVWIKHPDEAWTTINLVGMRHDQELHGLRDRVQLSEMNAAAMVSLHEQLKLQLEQQTLLLEAQETQIAAINDELTRYQKAVKEYQRTGSGILVKYKTRTKYKVIKPTPKKRARQKPATKAKQVTKKSKRGGKP